jgi:transcriptional regulator with XRE-family HTH domain
MTKHFNDSGPDRRRAGRVVARLRQRAGLTQPEAAEAADISTTAWQNYEYGRRYFTPQLVQRVTTALGYPEEIFEQEFERLGFDEPAAPAFTRTSAFELPLVGRGRAGDQGFHIFDVSDVEPKDFSYLFSSDTRVLQLAGESMVPYAEPGGFVTYHEHSAPKRNRGCVVHLKDGTFFVKRFERSDDERVYVTELHPVERLLDWPWELVAGVYPIGFRTD